VNFHHFDDDDVSNMYQQQIKASLGDMTVLYRQKFENYTGQFTKFDNENTQKPRSKPANPIEEKIQMNEYLIVWNQSNQ